jgi:hypothetical protein
MRRFYQCLLRLHPPSFQREFGAEMLWIFGESAPGQEVWLITDALISLARQWILRSGAWKVALALVGGLLQVTAAFAAISTAVPRLTVYPLDGTWTGRLISSATSTPLELRLGFEDASWSGQVHLDAGTRPIRDVRAGLYLRFRVDTGNSVVSFYGTPVRDSNGTKLAGVFEVKARGKTVRDGTWELTRDPELAEQP